MITLIEGATRVELEDIGEGWGGDYDPTDPEDTPLLRFTISRRDPEDATEWVQVEDASYCTQIPADTPEDVLKRIAQLIMDDVRHYVETGRSIKKLCERLSWLDPELDLPR